MAIAPITVGDTAAISKINAAIVEANKVAGKAEQSTVANLQSQVEQRATKAELAAVANLQSEIGQRATKAELAAEVETLAAADAVLDSKVAQNRYHLARQFSAGNWSRPGEAGLFWTHQIEGNPDAIVPIADQLIAIDSEGSVVRLSGATTLGPTRAYRVEPGRMYRVRFVIRRRENPADPANHTVRLALRWLARGKGALTTAMSLVEDIDDFVTASGRTEVTAVVARAAGEGVDITAPSGAVYFRPYVQTYGDDGVTDIEVVDVSDVTDAVLVPVDVGQFEDRIETLESADADNRLNEIEGTLGGAQLRDYLTRAAVESATISETVDAIRVMQFDLATPLSPAIYARAPVEPDHVGKVQSEDGAWWRIAPPEIVPAMMGADPTGTNPAGSIVAAAYGIKEPAYIPPGHVYSVAQDEIDFSKVYGYGRFYYGGTLHDLPSGHIRSNLNIKVGVSNAHFKTLADSFRYLSERMFYGDGSVTIEMIDADYTFASSAVAAGSGGAKQPFPHVIPHLPAGRRIQLLGKGIAGGGGGTTIHFDGTGTEGANLTFLTLDDCNFLQYINGFSIDGNNYSGRTGGVPGVSDGSPADLIAIIVREESRAVFGPDLYFEEVAGNSIMALQNSSIRLVNGTSGQHVKSVRSGRDAFVCDTGSFADWSYAESDGCIGAAFFGGRGGRSIVANVKAINTRCWIAASDNNKGFGIYSGEGHEWHADGLQAYGNQQTDVFLRGPSSTIKGNSVYIGRTSASPSAPALVAAKGLELQEGASAAGDDWFIYNATLIGAVLREAANVSGSRWNVRLNKEGINGKDSRLVLPRVTISNNTDRGAFLENSHFAFNSMIANNNGLNAIQAAGGEGWVRNVGADLVSVNNNGTSEHAAILLSHGARLDMDGVSLSGQFSNEKDIEVYAGTIESTGNTSAHIIVDE